MRQSCVFIVGKPVEDASDVNYVPSRFSFEDDKRKDLMAVKASQTRARGTKNKDYQN